MGISGLKILTKELILEMGLNHHDLWVVKIGEEIHGPYDGEELKKFADQNETIFNEALATRVENNDFQPFYTHALFQRCGPQIVKTTQTKKDFTAIWIMDRGLKVGPLAPRELDKRLEFGTLSLSDLVSTNDGMTWVKLHELSGYERRTHSNMELPFAPQDSSFERAKLELMEKINSSTDEMSVKDHLIEVAHHHSLGAKVIPIKIDEIPLRKEGEITVSSKMKWAPVAAVFVLAVIGGIGHLASNLNNDDEIEISDAPTRLKKKNRPQKNVATNLPTQMPIRNPASIPREYPSQNVPTPGTGTTHFSQGQQFPTYIETHSRIEENAAEAYSEQMNDVPLEQNEVHSLVDQNQIQEGQTLDGVMNGEGVPSQPAESHEVQESSDF